MRTTEIQPGAHQWRNTQPLQARVVDRLADILLVFNDIMDMVEEDRGLRQQMEPAIETIWHKINEFSIEVERELVRDFTN